MRSLLLLGQREVTLHSRVVSYALKRSPRAKYVRLEIDEEGLTVVVPRRFDTVSLDEILQRRASWILRELEKLSRRTGAEKSSSLRSGDSVPYLGRELRLRIIQGGQNHACIQMNGDELLITRPVSPQNGANLILEMWFRRQAAGFLRHRVMLIASKLGVRHGRITIRGQKTRWASCSPRGNLSFNWRLMMAPEAVVDYVIIHELTHLREMNHTERFWRLVAERCPTWKENRAWLKNHGAALSATSIFLA